MERSRFLPSEVLRLAGRAVGAILVLALVGCADSQPTPEPLTKKELASLRLEGGISPHLPIRFSATITNTLDSRELRTLQFEVDGRRFDVRRRISPGESRRLSFQWVYPEDESWESAGSVAVPWRLVAAEAVPVETGR